MSSSAEGAVPTVTVPEPVTIPCSLRDADKAFKTTPVVSVTGPTSEPERATVVVAVGVAFVTLPAKFTTVPKRSTASVIEPSRVKVPLEAIAPNTRAVGVLPFAGVPVAFASSDIAFTPAASTLKRSAALEV